MKHLILIVIAVVFFGTQNTFAKGIPIRIGNIEHIKKTFDLPDTEDYKSSKTGKYLDLGVKYEVYEVIWMPVWVTKSPVIVGVEGDSTDEYYDLTPEQISEILVANNLKEEDVLKVSFFSKYTGLLVLVPILLLVVWGYFIKDNDDEEQEDVKTE